MIEPVIYLSDLKKVNVVQLREIIFIKAQRSYCQVLLQNGESIIHSKPMAAIEKEFSVYMFLHIHWFCMGLVKLLYCCKERNTFRRKYFHIIT